MELIEAMRTTGTCRYFSDRPVPDELLYQAFDAARFGPQGGNRQPVRYIVVRDAARKKALADLYLPPWKAYLAAISTGDINVGALDKTVQAADDFAETCTRCPPWSSSSREMAGLHPTDAELGRLSVVGGCSIYPTMQNLCLALRDQGVATAVTTLLCLSEPAVTELLEIPEGFITAAHIAVGYPANGFPTKLTRNPVEDIVSLETFGDPMFPADAASGALRASPDDSLAGHHRSPLGRSTLGDQLRRHAAQPAGQGRVRRVRRRRRPDGGHLRRARRHGQPRRPRPARPGRPARGPGCCPGPQPGRRRRGLLRRAQARARCSPCVNPLLKPAEIAPAAQHAEPTVLVATQDFVPAASQAVDGLVIACLVLDAPAGDDSTTPPGDGCPDPASRAGPGHRAGRRGRRARRRDARLHQRYRGSTQGRDDPAPQLPHLDGARVELGPADRTGRHVAVRHAVLHDRRPGVDDHA